MAKKRKALLPETEEVLGLLVRSGLIGDMRIENEKARDAKQRKQQTAYHNTELLLKQYRNIAWMLECFPEQIAAELDEPFEDVDRLIDRLDVDMAFGNKKLENRLAGIEKTRLILDRVNEALTLLKKRPDDGERLYQLIYITYILPEKLSHVEILFRLNVSSRHYYRLREQAFEMLSTRLWAAPKREIDFLIELITILENNKKR